MNLDKQYGASRTQTFFWVLLRLKHTAPASASNMFCFFSSSNPFACWSEFDIRNNFDVIVIERSEGLQLKLDLQHSHNQWKRSAGRQRAQIRCYFCESTRLPIGCAAFFFFAALNLTSFHFIMFRWPLICSKFKWIVFMCVCVLYCRILFPLVCVTANNITHLPSAHSRCAFGMALPVACSSVTWNWIYFRLRRSSATYCREARRNYTTFLCAFSSGRRTVKAKSVRRMDSDCNVHGMRVAHERIKDWVFSRFTPLQFRIPLCIMWIIWSEQKQKKVHIMCRSRRHWRRWKAKTINEEETGHTKSVYVNGNKVQPKNKEIIFFLPRDVTQQPRRQ